MHRYFSVGALLLLTATTAGIAIDAAARERGFLTAQRHERSTVDQANWPLFLASGSRELGDHSDRFAERDRRHHDDDDDDDEADSRATIPQNGPADPNAPVPDNGLFNGNSRPKVEVR